MNIRFHAIGVEGRALLTLAAPLAAAQVSQMAMSLTTSLQLGHLDSLELAAGGLGASITSMLVLVTQGLLAGIQPSIAQARGRNDAMTQSTYALMLASAWSVVLLASLVIVVLLVNMEPLLLAASVEVDIAQRTAAYCRAFAWGIPPLLGYVPLRYYLTTLGRTRVVMLLAVAGALLNAAFGWVLIFGHMGFPRLGAEGGGYALSLTWWCLLAALFWHCHTQRQMPFARLPERAALRLGVKELFSVGWPIGGLYAAEIGLISLASVQMGQFGTVDLGAHLICLNIVNLVFMVPLALSQAATIRVGMITGLGEPTRAQLSGWVSLGLGAIFMAVTGLVLAWQQPRIVAWFLSPHDEHYSAISAVTAKLFLILAVYFVFDGLQAIATGALRGLKDTYVPMLICIAGYWILAFPTSLLLAYGMGMGVVGFWIGYALGLSGAAVALVYRWWQMARTPLSKTAHPSFQP